ncbi:MAG: hypothetical protein QW197_01260 [Candidatus Aenigmatarchaeota archaeon]
MEVYIIGLTLILVIVFGIFLLLKRREERNFLEALEEIERSLISMQNSIRSALMVLKEDEKVKRKKHARKRSV